MTLHLDGSEGEGGGQILRSALALSLATGIPFHLSNIRANRARPGLRPQHVAGVHAATRVGNADVEGARKGSRELTFSPRGVEPGIYHFEVGTAGSAVLVLQTVLPPLLTARERSTITVDGGTHIPHAPPFEFLARTLLPQLERLGPRLTTRLIRPGFLPVGGGRIVVEVEPAEALVPYECLARGKLVRTRATALVSELPVHIAKRELSVVAKRLGWPRDDLVVQEVLRARGPGNALVLDLACEHIHEVAFAPGERGVRAETVALRAVTEAFRYLEADVPVGEHLADQLLLPLALGRGGTFRTLVLSSHALTQIDLIRRFLDVEVDVEPCGPGSVEVRVHSAAGTRSSATTSPT